MYYMYDIRITIRNTGDLTLNSSRLNISTAEGEQTFLEPGGPGINIYPGKEQTLRFDRYPYTILHFHSPGEKRLIIELKDRAGKVYSLSGTITVPEKPPVE